MKVWQKITGQIGPFLGMLFLSVELYFRFFKHKSVCSTKSCAIVGDYVRIGETNLIVLGLIFFALLWIFLFFWFRYFKTWLKNIILFLFGTALAADGALIGFQLFGLKTQCQLCFAVAGILLFSVLGYGISQKKIFPIILGLSLWFAGLSSGYLLQYPELPPRITKLELLSWPKEKKREWPKFYLFISLHCGHCSRLLANLAVNPDIATVNWKIFIVDSGEKDMRKIAYILNSKDTPKNPFLEILKLEADKVKKEDLKQQEVTKKLEENILKIQSFLRGHRIMGVPLLVADENSGKRVFLVGRKHILNYLKEKGFIERILYIPGEEIE